MVEYTEGEPVYETEAETELRLASDKQEKPEPDGDKKITEYELGIQQRLAHEAAILRDRTYKKGQLKDEPGLRYDADKLRYDLIPPEVLDALARVYGDGAEEYHDRDWEKGISYSRVIRCIFSHLVKYLCGYRYDKDLPQCEHMAMVMWNAAQILTYDIRNMAKEFNDLPHWRASTCLLDNIKKEIPADKMMGGTVKT